MGNFTSDNSLGVVISGQFFYGAIVLAAIVRASLSGGQLPWRQIFEGAVIRKAIILGGNCRGRGGQLSKGQLSGGQFPREEVSRGQFFCSILRHLPPPQIIISRTIAPWIITPRIIAPQTNAKATTEMCSTKQLSTLVTIYPMYYLTWSSSFSKITGWRRN